MGVNFKVAHREEVIKNMLFCSKECPEDFFQQKAFSLLSTQYYCTLHIIF